ncbi:LysR substrate-binding domain-containing protein [Agrobacterium vitis]|uniref:LysR substrate-binding domain-containing protein n=1 Tax=Agrobacterium vitis TaxID=373 RepID=UPI0018D22EDE
MVEPIKTDSIQAIATFERVVANGSLSTAAKEMGVSLAVVSKRLISLEKNIGARLLNRTTRQLSLTDEGRTFYPHCVSLLGELRMAEEAVATHRDGISGVVRLTASNAFARRQIAPCLGAFIDRHPGIKVELIADDDLVDIVKHGIDVAIRQKAELENSELVAHVIAHDRRILCASPGYLNKHGLPVKPEDLKRHRCIAFGNPPLTSWSLSNGNETLVIEIAPAIYVNAGDSAHAAAISDGGIVAKSIWEVADDIKEGRLIEVLRGWKGPERPIYAVYPSVRYRAQRVSVFVSFLTERLKARSIE